MNTKQLYQLFGLMLITVLLSCGNNEKSLTASTSEPIAVTVRKASYETRHNGLTVSGTIEASKSTVLRTRVMGYVDQIHVKPGERVAKGQLLLSINSADLLAKKAQIKARILEASAQFEIVEKDFKRYTALFESNSASQKELDDITARYNMAKAQLQSAREMKNEIDAQFTYTNIRAPFSGIIASKMVEPGTLANPGMPLLLVESPNSFEVVAKVSERNIHQIKTEMPVELAVSSTGSNFKGYVSEVNTSSTLSGGQYLTTITMLDPGEELRSGMFVTVRFPGVASYESSKEPMLRVPKSALISRGQLTGIFTVSQQNTAVLRWLRLGRTTGDSIEVLSGLTEGEAYILSSEEKLFNGARLNIQ